MAEAAPATPPAGTPPASPPATPPAAPPWHQGIEADVIGSWQNKGWDISDPAKLVQEVTKSWKAAERHIGAPADRIVRLPDNNNDPNAWASVWEKLGAPKEAKDYEIPTKFSDNTDVEAGLVDTLRNTFAKAHLPKEAASEVSKAIVKFIEDADKSESVIATQKRTEQLAALDREWGTNKDANMLVALNGARRLGLSQEQVRSLEDALGADTAAKLFHRIGVGTTETSFVEGGNRTNSPTTSEQARSRLNDLMSDKDGWAKRFTAGGAVEKREFRALMEQIHGISEARELASM